MNKNNCVQKRNTFQLRIILLKINRRLLSPKREEGKEMSNNTSSIVSKVWSFCNPLRDVGVGYGDYLEQLTYLLFLKMADEYESRIKN